MKLVRGPVVFYLIGVPAVGKYTIAKEIHRLTGATVVDNQLVNLPIFRVLGYDGHDSFPFPDGAWAEIEKIREAVLSVVERLCAPDRSFVFTNVLEAGNPGDEALFRRVEALARSRRAGFFPTWLTCRADVLRERKDSPDRRSRMKDVDVTNVAHYAKDFRVLEMPHPHALRLDTSEARAEALARRIVEHVQRVQGLEGPSPSSAARPRSGRG